MKRALAGSDAMATLILKCRRPEVYNPEAAAAMRSIHESSNSNRKISLQDALTEIARLGLRAPLLECDYVEIDNGDDHAGPTNGSDDPA